MAECVCLKCQAVKPDDGFKWCKSCRKIQQEYNAKHRKNVEDHKSKTYNTVQTQKNQRPKPKKRSKKKKSFDEVLKDVDAYNKKHGTSLSYGKYKALERQGRLLQ